MKKNKLICKLLFALFFLSSVTFTAAAQETEAVESEASTEEVENSETTSTKKKEKTKKTKKKKAKKTKKNKEQASEAEVPPAAEVSEKESKKEPKPGRKNINETFGKVNFRVNSKFGSFTMGVVNASEKKVNVLSNSNEFTTNGFFLKAGKKIYNLNTDNAVKTSSLKKDNNVTIYYDIKDLAKVELSFDFIASEKDVSEDIVKVTAHVINEGKKKEDFSLKAVLDTVLGESGTYHFITGDGIPVKNETAYRTLKYQKSFLSINDAAALQLIFSGADCVEPDFVGLASYSTIANPGWEPGMSMIRPFDTVFSYNNSAVCAIWKSVELPPEKDFKIVFYMALAADGLKPPVEKLVGKARKTDEVENKETYESVKEFTINAPYAEVQSISESPVQTAESSVQEKPAVSEVEKTGNKITKEQISPEYIQALLDRIAELEEDSPSNNRQELLLLNAELDAILAYLRQ